MKEINNWREASIRDITSFINNICAEWEEDLCPVDKLFRQTDALRRNSCGECVICREGLLQVSIIAKGLTEGTGKNGDLELLHELADNLLINSSCEYGKIVGSNIMDLLKKDKEVFEKHLKRKRCDYAVCQKLQSAELTMPVGDGLMSGKRRRRSDTE